VYITQLIGLCLGLSPAQLGMHKCVVSPKPVIELVRSNERRDVL
jgi:heterodisulfide reductase subunit B